MRLQLVVLGSGQDGGAPQLGGPPVSTTRTASSVAVVGEGLCLLFDASPDLRLQSHALRTGTYAPEHDRTGDGDTALFDAIFITHCHIGHYTGLVHFGREAANASQVPLFASPSVVEALTSNEPWSSLFRNGNLIAMPMDGSIAFGGLSVDRIPVPHRSEISDASAFSISVDGEPWALYLPDIDSWDSWPDALEVVERHRVSILDATFGAIDELHGRDVADVPHPLVDDTIERFSSLAGDRLLVLSHINHSNGLNDPASRITQRATGNGFAVAFDGMTIEYGADRR